MTTQELTGRLIADWFSHRSTSAWGPARNMSSHHCMLNHYMKGVGPDNDCVMPVYLSEHFERIAHLRNARLSEAEISCWTSQEFSFIPRITILLSYWHTIGSYQLTKYIYKNHKFMCGRGILMDINQRPLILATAKVKKVTDRSTDTMMLYRTEPTIHISPLIFLNKEYAIWKNWVVNYLLPMSGTITIQDTTLNCYPSLRPHKKSFPIKIQVHPLDEFFYKVGSFQVGDDVQQLAQTALEEHFDRIYNVLR